MRRRARRINGLLRFIIFLLICAVVITAVYTVMNTNGAFEDWQRSDRAAEIKKYAEGNGIPLSEYPQEIIELYERNPETKAFVLEYPQKKDDTPEIDLASEYERGKIPLLMQWDQRWGYGKYGNGIIALNACGPVCLSMVAVYLKDDIKYDPRWMADFSEDEGYYVPDNGTAWSLMSEGARQLGLTSRELPLEESIVASELDSGHPIICIMGEGDFTTSGHYIVLTGYEDGKVSVNDPNSYENSDKLWEFSEIRDQIRNLWSYTI